MKLKEWLRNHPKTAIGGTTIFLVFVVVLVVLVVLQSTKQVAAPPPTPPATGSGSPSRPSTPAVTTCTRSDKIAIEKDCLCEMALTCRKGSYCWLDSTCNSKQRKFLYVLSLKTELKGVDPDDFNKNTNMVQAFKNTVAKLLDNVSPEDV